MVKKLNVLFTCKILLIALQIFLFKSVYYKSIHSVNISIYIAIFSIIFNLLIGATFYYIFVGRKELKKSFLIYLVVRMVFLIIIFAGSCLYISSHVIQIALIDKINVLIEIGNGPDLIYEALKKELLLYQIYYRSLAIGGLLGLLINRILYAEKRESISQ